MYLVLTSQFSHIEHLLIPNLVTDFIKQFNPSDPRPDTIKYVWSRLLPSPDGEIHNSSHPKPFILAILYMLHMERFLSERPRGDNNQPGEIKVMRREILKRFHVWIPCTCRRKCRSRWNFVSDIGICQPEAKSAEKCKVKSVVEGQKDSEKGFQIWESLVESWKRSKG